MRKARGLSFLAQASNLLHCYLVSENALKFSETIGIMVKGWYVYCTNCIHEDLIDRDQDQLLIFAQDLHISTISKFLLQNHRTEIEFHTEP